MNRITFSTIALLAIACLTFLSSCSKEEVVLAAESEIENNLESPFLNRIVDVTHEYNYYGDVFSVTYTLDQETNEVLDRKGDMEKAKEVFQDGETTPQGFYFNLTELNETGKTSVQVFDTQDEVAELTGRGGPSASQHCQYFESNGSATYQFFKHANYISILGDLTKYSKEWLGWNNVMSHNNDQISSFRIVGTQRPTGFNGPSGVLTLFDNICYGGFWISFASDSHVLQCPNLTVVCLQSTLTSTGSFNDKINDKTSSLQGRWFY